MRRRKRWGEDEENKDVTAARIVIPARFVKHVVTKSCRKVHSLHARFVNTWWQVVPKGSFATCTFCQHVVTSRAERFIRYMHVLSTRGDKSCRKVHFATCTFCQHVVTSRAERFIRYMHVLSTRGDKSCRKVHSLHAHFVTPSQATLPHSLFPLSSMCVRVCVRVCVYAWVRACVRIVLCCVVLNWNYALLWVYTRLLRVCLMHWRNRWFDFVRLKVNVDRLWVWWLHVSFCHDVLL